MEWMCPLFGSDNQLPGNQSYISTQDPSASNESGFSPMNVSSIGGAGGALSAYPWTYQQVIERIAIPSLCVFGMVGNVLTFFILTRRMNEGIEVIEKGSLVGITALAVSDFMFCLANLFFSFYSSDRIFYSERNLTLFFTLYGHYFQNVFIKTSTWITVVMAIYRHHVVIHPIRSKQHLIKGHSLCAIILGSIFWTLIHLPQLWTWKITQIQCDSTHTFLVLDVGAFEADKTFRQSFLYLWAILGFFLPVCVLGYCNVKLIKALNTSRSRMDDSLRRDRRSERHAVSLRINVTLISIVVCFFLFNFPSESFHFYLEMAPSNSSNESNALPLAVAVVTCNLLQTLNMSLNFALYCVVNSHFRNAAKNMFTSGCRLFAGVSRPEWLPQTTSFATRCEEVQLRNLTQDEV